MNETIEKLTGITADCCVTILLRTHRGFPGNEKDAIVLKDLVKEAETTLLARYDKQLATSIIDKINNLAATIDHQQNLEGMALFVNENIAEYLRLPIEIENKVVINRSFATTPLARALHAAYSYYVLTLSREKARLIEALNGKVTREVENGFPMENSYPVEGYQNTLPVEQDNLVSEFFKRVNQQLNETLKERPMPVIICTDEAGYSEYLKVAENKEAIAGHLNGNRDGEKAHEIVEAAWPLAKQFFNEKNLQRLSELSAAIGAKNFETEISSIWRAVKEGRGRTLFVKQRQFPAERPGNDIIELPLPESGRKVNVDDIIDEMIEKNIELGGDTVFINDDELNEYNGLALVTRY